MAMVCVSGARECDGCMSCQPEPAPYNCTICDLECETVYYDKFDNIVGCDNCITTKEYYEMDIEN
jgi:hypothetical protein